MGTPADNRSYREAHPNDLMALRHAVMDLLNAVEEIKCRMLFARPDDRVMHKRVEKHLEEARKQLRRIPETTG